MVFKELLGGDVFQRGAMINNPYVKSINVINATNGAKYNAFNLKDGAILVVGSGETVTFLGRWPTLGLGCDIPSSGA